ncbi:glycine cleavage system protein H [Hahella sp. HN01]|uniref:glycine cleavage system protein H n=1 Tax=Hahella sp. HN01 TaxID=2847262 RepID=UPI001C1EDE3E|nr:hypothetical protein [Hahella sp. HN01]MBU6955885.1 hypothetical protein [Hahella sp. HN01]
MNETRSTLKYYSCHEWVRILASFAIVGVTDFVSDLKGSIRLSCNVDYTKLYVSGEQIGTLETLRGETLPFYMPISGYIVSTNNHPSHDTSNPYGNDWLLIVKIEDASDIKELMSESEYDITFRHSPMFAYA